MRAFSGAVFLMALAASAAVASPLSGIKDLASEASERMDTKNGTLAVLPLANGRFVIRIRDNATGIELDYGPVDGYSSEEIEGMIRQVEWHATGVRGMRMASIGGGILAIGSELARLDANQVAITQANRSHICDRLYGEVAALKKKTASHVRSIFVGIGSVGMIAVGLAGPEPEKIRNIAKSLRDALAKPGQAVALDDSLDAMPVVDIHGRLAEYGLLARRTR